MEKYWSVEEANKTLPVLREILRVLLEQNKRAALARQSVIELNERLGSNGHAVGKELEHRSARLRDAVGQMKQGIEQLRSIGCEVKDLEMGLIDFLGLRDGEEILLCWQLDEPEVLYWHGRDEGFASRKPL